MRTSGKKLTSYVLVLALLFQTVSITAPLPPDPPPAPDWFHVHFSEDPTDVISPNGGNFKLGNSTASDVPVKVIFTLNGETDHEYVDVGEPFYVSGDAGTDIKISIPSGNGCEDGWVSCELWQKPKDPPS